MLLTILKYYLNIFKNLYTIILGAPHNLQVISKSSDTEMATFLAENSKKIDAKNVNLEVTIRLAVCFKKETVLEFLAKKGENENEVSMGDTVLHFGYTVHCGPDLWESFFNFLRLLHLEIGKLLGFDIVVLK